jgi:phage recombination protein Bet
MTNNLPAVIAERDITAETYNVLKSMTFPDCNDDEVLAVAIDYCRARKLDILKKPVHIVPVWSSKKKRYVETVWPGIYEYRTTASRTGEYAGKDAPVYGDDVTEEFGKGDATKSYTYPKSCSVTVYRMISGERCGFTGYVMWKEAAVFNNKTGLPNSMWSKRTYSQLAKCAEAEALRAAFPDEIGGLTTAEEMEGADINAAMQDVTPQAENATFHNRVKDEAGITDVTPDDDGSEDKEPDTKTIILHNGTITVEDNKLVYDALLHELLEIDGKQDRVDLINRNLHIIRKLVTDGQQELVDELHKAADEGAS